MNMLRNWRVSAPQLAHRLANHEVDQEVLKTRSAIIVGNVYGDTRFDDGGDTAIHAIRRINGAYVATTVHGTEYLLSDVDSSPLPAAMVICDWKIVFETDTRSKYVHEFKKAFKDLIMSESTVPNGGDYVIKNFALPLNFSVACTILKSKVTISDLESVYKFTLENGETRYYFEGGENYVEFHLEDWNEDQAADFGVII